MGRLMRAGLIAGTCLALAAPAFAQITNEACMLRCLDHGNLEQTCEARCSSGVPPAAPLRPNRSSEPAQQPAPQSAPALPAASTPPLATQPTPAVPQPANAPPSPSSVGQPAPQPAQNQ